MCQHHICWLNNERLLGVKQLSRHQGHSNRAPVYYNNNNVLKSLVVSTLSQFQHNLVLKKESRGGYSQDRDMWQKKGCSTFIVISKSHAGHILESTYYVSYSQCWILFCCVLTIWQWWCFLIEYKKHSLWKAFCCCMTSMLCVKAMDYLITMKPLLQTKHLWENKPPRPGIILLSFPTMTCLKAMIKDKKTLIAGPHTLPTVPSWPEHNTIIWT